ncbi:MAG: hypothetical protein LBI20_02155 [Holosporales bacterium]|jgi:hypothetical protein|nr:hypothetical protein [Holosporales bacterium]
MPIVMAPVERESISEAPAPVPLPSFEEWNLEDDDPFRLEDMDTGLDWMGTIPREDPPIPGAQ